MKKNYYPPTLKCKELSATDVLTESGDLTQQDIEWTPEGEFITN